MSKSEFLKIIQDQREEKKEERFEGTFLDYLEHVKENPHIVNIKITLKKAQGKLNSLKSFIKERKNIDYNY